MKWEMIIIFAMILIFAGYKYWLDKQDKHKTETLTDKQATTLFKKWK